MRELCFMYLLLFIGRDSFCNCEDPLHDCKIPECAVLDGSKDYHKVNVTANDDGSVRLFTFCYRGSQNKFLKLWMNAKLSITKNSEDQELYIYRGSNLTQVKQEAKNGSPWWKHMFTLTLQKKEEITFEPFNVSCIGISSTKPYQIEFKVKNPDLWLITYVIAGIIIVFWAPIWSRNVMIHYSTGVSVGVVLSVLLVAFVIQKMLPQRLKTLGNITVLVGGSTGLFLLKWISTRLHDLAKDHWQYLLGYVLVTGFISFALVYRYGPVKEERTLNIIQWLLQIIGLTLIYNGTQLSEASIAIILVVLTVYNFPTTYLNKVKMFVRYRVFRPKPRFLTEEEYIELKDRETEKALQELREYCQSPQCQAWKVISRIKSPSRFASFVEGDDHLSDDEHYDHSVYSTTLPSNMNYDEDDMSEIDFRLTSP